MKKVLLSIVALALLSGSALAAVNVKQAADGTYYNAQTGQATDVSGNVLVSGAPTNRLAGTALIDNSALATAGIDSFAAPVSVANYNHLTLLIRSGNQSARFAVQVRYHIGGVADSVSTFIIRHNAFVFADSTTAIAMGSPDVDATATTIGSFEFLARIVRPAVPVSPGGAWTNRVYPLIISGGAPRWYESVSVRIRYLGGNAATVPVKVYLVGTSL